MWKRRLKKNCCVLLLSFFQVALLAQESHPEFTGSVDRAVEVAESLTTLLENIATTNEEQKQRLQDLTLSLSETEGLLSNSNALIDNLKGALHQQGTMLNALSEQLKQQEQIYRAQLAYQSTLQSRLSRYKVTLLVVVPLVSVSCFVAGVLVGVNR